MFQAMTVEIGQMFSGSRLDKVVQVAAGTLVLRFWTGREKAQLLFRAEEGPVFFRTRDAHAAPARPPRFCQLLRARLRRLTSVQAEPLDRVVHLHFTGPDQEHYDLVFEACGARGNLVLVDDAGRIVDLLFRAADRRGLMPGVPYHLPEQKDRLSLFGEPHEVVAALQAAEESGDPGRVDLAPMSPALAHDIAMARRAGQSYDTILRRIRSVFSSGDFTPTRIAWDGRSGLLPLSLVVRDETTADFPDLSALVEANLAEQGRETAKDLAERMATSIKKQRRRLEKRLEHIAAERDRQADPERFRISGELLLANLHRCQRGDKEIEVQDYYRSPAETVTIELDRKATPQQNAEHYFKLYRKAGRASHHHERRLRETREELEWLDQIEHSLDEAASGDDLYQVQLELEAAGLLKQVKGSLGKRRMVRPEDQLHNTVTPGGWQLYWGRNSRTNDHVSRTMTGANDLWFHAKGMPGSHLVLKCGDAADRVAETDLLYAASIAAGYSRGKDAGKVEVIVAQGRNVRKPKGAKPGLVTVDSYRTVMVSPQRLDSA